MSRADGCKSRYLQLPMADLNPNDDCYPEKFLWEDGRYDREIVLCRVVGGGHTWPGSTLPLYLFFLGNVCLDFNASQMIWQFFRNIRRNFQRGRTIPPAEENRLRR
jgi:polyhydroxybutyrate depolymerase